MCLAVYTGSVRSILFTGRPPKLAVAQHVASQKAYLPKV